MGNPTLGGEPGAGGSTSCIFQMIKNKSPNVPTLCAGDALRSSPWQAIRYLSLLCSVSGDGDSTNASLSSSQAASSCVWQMPPQEGGPFLLFPPLCFRLSLDSGQAFQATDPGRQTLFLGSSSHLASITTSLLPFPLGLKVLTATLDCESLGVSTFLLDFLYLPTNSVHPLFLTLSSFDPTGILSSATLTDILPYVNLLILTPNQQKEKWIWKMKSQILHFNLRFIMF